MKKILSLVIACLAIALLTFAFITPAFTAPSCSKNPKPGCHPDDGSGDTGTMYSGLIVGAVIGESGKDPWVGGFGGGAASIGLNNSENRDVGKFTELSNLIDSNGDAATAPCFPGNNYPLIQALVKQGKKGKAEAAFWLNGLSNDGSETPVRYELRFFGDFIEGQRWPPVCESADLLMTTWKLTAEGGKNIRGLSCTSNGDTQVTVTITDESNSCP